MVPYPSFASSRSDRAGTVALGNCRKRRRVVRDAVAIVRVARPGVVRSATGGSGISSATFCLVAVVVFTRTEVAEAARSLMGL